MQRKEKTINFLKSYFFTQTVKVLRHKHNKSGHILYMNPKKKLKRSSKVHDKNNLQLWSGLAESDREQHFFPSYLSPDQIRFLDKETHWM